MTTIKRTATQLELIAGDEILMIAGSHTGIQGTLEECDGSLWPWFRITKVPVGSTRGVGAPVPLRLTDSEGNLQFRRVLPKDSKGFIQNTGTAPELKTGQEIDILYVDGSLITSTDFDRAFKADNTGEWYAACNWKVGGIRSLIRAYRFPEDRPQVVPLAEQATLGELLAELKAELVGVNSHIESLTAELEAAKVTKAALLLKVEGHGLTFIVEKESEVENAATARERGDLRVGSVLCCVNVSDELYGEHIAGTDYRIIQKDEGDGHEFKLQSEDGLGVWVCNSELSNFTVVSL